MHNKTLNELAAGLKEKQFSSRELTEHFLGRIVGHATHEKQILCHDNLLKPGAIQRRGVKQLLRCHLPQE